MIMPFFRCSRLPCLQRGLLLLILCGAFMFALGTIESAVAEGDVRVHIVRAGETLSGIAQRYRVDLRELANYNGITNLNQIRVGQRLRIPPASLPPTRVRPATTEPRLVPLTSSTLVPFARPTSTPVPRSHSVAPTSPARSGEVSYIVYAGDSLTGIGARFGISASAIMERNRLPSSRIYVGQRLIIPVNSQAVIVPPPTPTVEFQTNLPVVTNHEAPPEASDPQPATDEDS